MGQPLRDRFLAPAFVAQIFQLSAALIALGNTDQSLGRAVIAVEQHILARLAQFRVDRVIHIQLPGIDDGHGKPGRDGMVEEDAVHCAAHRLIAAEGEAEVG